MFDQIDFTLPPGHKFSFLTDARRLISARLHIRDSDQCSSLVWTRGWPSNPMAASSLLLLLLLGLLDPQPATIYNYYLCGYARNIIMICWRAHKRDTVTTPRKVPRTFNIWLLSNYISHPNRTRLTCQLGTEWRTEWISSHLQTFRGIKIRRPPILINGPNVQSRNK